MYPRQMSDDMSSLVGKSLGQFRVVERIGAGGMATVFKAYQPTLDRHVAIKVLPPHHARDQVFVKRFVQEARSVAKLTHPNIVQIHDFSSEEESNLTYIVMEYVEGGTLKDRLKRALPVPEAAGYIIQAAEGLDCAHRNGIIHRDVKMGIYSSLTLASPKFLRAQPISHAWVLVLAHRNICPLNRAQGRVSIDVAISTR